MSLLAVWLLTLSCAAPGALSPEGIRGTDVSSDGADALEMRPPGAPRGPPLRTPPARPGRGGRNRNRNPFEPRERVFNAEPTREQREAARRRSENAAHEQTLRAQYWRLKAEAERLYPDKVGLYEEHHFWPRYLGGRADGPTYRVPAPYHQLVTNAFRARWAYGRNTPTPEEARQIMMKVYAEFPIPQLIGIPDP
ncbi:hypothetical protein JQX13_14760 [Archangium violaceum]|uniref:hypothetical protein n=1 Tax=Archangium violaceum TaxID=83451 RepID=UPI00193B7DB0|nr:hypothetical protein [Archangium violaceum]QRK11218.1 hypothetical protein JQX13_14760 [Archangium violaceum]